MNWLNAGASVAVVGAVYFIFNKFKNVIVPDVAGAIDSFTGSALRSIIVPEGPNGVVVEYWKRHGVEFEWFMSVARGEQPIPDFLKLFLPSGCTVGLLYHGLFNFSMNTTVGDVENYLGVGLHGGSGDLISNLATYADAIRWRIDTLEEIKQQVEYEGLWDVVI